jgi:hypothetical protein
MPLQLISIQFRKRDPDVSRAIPLRRNPDKAPFGLPEWHSGQDEVFVAWRLDRTTSGQVSVDAGFRSDVAGQFQIKADDPSGLNLSGSVPPFTVGLPANVTVVVTAQLAAPRLTDGTLAKVAMQTDTWQWSWRAGTDEPWTPLVATSHRSYAVLGAPSAPWNDTQPEIYVWADALEFSCKWAEGASTADEASGKIVQALFDLGSGQAPLFGYGGSASYTHGAGAEPYFGCVDFIRYLNTGRPMRQLIDCHDIACAVSTFANALGASLIQGLVRKAKIQTFRTKPGFTLGGRPAPEEFLEHEMAWGGQAQDFDPVWDACLQVDADDKPGTPPFDFKLLPGAPYTAESGQGYRDRLAVAKDAQRLPAPGPRIPADNRVLGTAYSPPRFTPATRPSSSVDTDKLHQFLETHQFTPWEMFEWYREFVTSDEVIFRSELIAAGGIPMATAAVEWHRCPSVQRAIDVFRDSLGFFSAPVAPIEDVGDAAFGLKNGDSVVFLRWNVVIRISRGSFQAGPLLLLPSTIDKALVATFSAAMI